MFHIEMRNAMEGLRQIVEEPRDVKTRRQTNSNEIKQCELRRLIEDCDQDIKEIRTLVTKADETSTQFVRYTSTLTAEQREEQQETLDRFQAAIDNEVCKLAKRRLKEIGKIRFDYSIEHDEVSLALGRLDGRSPHRTPARTETVQLPTLHLEKFSGDRMRWPEFFENFSSAIHKSSMAKIQKMTYLRSLVVGEAKSVIDGLELSGESYDIAIELLQSRYDNKEERIRELYHRVSSLKVCRSFEDCKEFATKLECYCRQLEAAGESVESRQMYMSLEQKLSKPMLREILKEKEQTAKWSTALFRSKLQELIVREEAFQRVSSVHHVPEQPRFQRSTPVINQQHREVRRFHQPQQSVAFAAPTREQIPACPKALFQRTNLKPANSSPAAYSKYNKPTCPFCQGDHGAEECSQFRTIEQRRDRVKLYNRCFKCLRTDHRINQCQSSRGCRHCGKTHHSALCTVKYGSRVENEVSTAATEPSPANRVLLMTASAIVRNPETSLKQEATLFFDTGSHRSFVTREIVRRLKLEVKSEEKLSLCTFGAEKPKEYYSSKVKAHIRTQSGLEIPLQLNVVDDIIPKPVPMAIINGREPIDFDKFGRFVDKIIVNRNPDILIGIDHLHEFKIVNAKELESGFVISDSVLGHIISGRAKESSDHGSRPELSLLTVDIGNDKSRNDENLFDLVQDHFDREKTGTEEHLAEDDESRIVESFNESLRMVDGRYEVTLPWKEKEPTLESNYGLASGRLRSTMRTLKQRPELLEQYHKTMMDQLDKEIIEVVPKRSTGQGTIIHYLPHQPVVKEDKLHTKLRIVYDGSAKAGKKSVSINQCLHRGPLLLCDLVGMLLRFRIPKVCIVADIEKAFLQLSVAPKDRDACRFLWPTDPTSTEWYKRIETYRFRRVTFGLICSPFLLAATVKEHLRRDGSQLAKNMLENIYVDNVVIHADSMQETSELCRQSKEIFQRASMNLREFASNDRASMAKLPEADRTPTVQLKVLGLKWDTEKDVFIMHVQSTPDEHPTKRSVLKRIAAVYDPIGWLAPGLLSAKQFFQSIWKTKMDWDATLSEDESRRWNRIVESWNHAITIPRRLFQETGSHELHVFADASNEAFGTAAFLRTSAETSPAARLLFAKSRVKPTNSKATIPKLELQALTLAVQVANFLKGQLTIEKIQLWTDSQCVIHWLNSTSKMERYVENRVKKIRPFHVKYVNTSENPADLVTRGLTFADLDKCDLWWKGPEWLHKPGQIGQSSPSFDPEEYESRKREEIFHVTSLPVMEQTVESVMDISKCSSLRKAKRITAVMLRFIDQARKKSKLKSRVWTASELKRAKDLLVKEAQQREPPTEEMKRSLEMYQDEKNIWRCRGRIGLSQLHRDTQQPIWLPKEDRLTTLIILEAHQETFHAGSTMTLARIREEYWLPQGRKRVQSAILHSCMACRRWNAKPYKLPKMPDLPGKRVTRSRPFENTGLDYFGPIIVRQEKAMEPKKVWVCIFTCFVTRAVHLEVAQDLSAETFLAAFRRFISRRGTPRTVMSDNGTNFKLASKVIVEKWKEVLTSKSTQKMAAEHGIQWKFIAERAPWRGGFWERLIQIVKNALKKTVGKRILQQDEFQTFITEIEMVINQRPVTYQSETETIKALRPIDFLIPYETESDSPRIDIEESKDPTYRYQNTNRDQLGESYDRVLQRIETFWRTWHAEYLTSLRERQNTLDFKQGRTSNKFPRRGEVVLVQENDIPRSQWRLAIVQELISGRDGEIRTARIRNGNRETSRAINVLYPLEVTSEEKEPEAVQENPQICGIIFVNTIHSCNIKSGDFRQSSMDDEISLLDYSEEEHEREVEVAPKVPEAEVTIATTDNPKERDRNANRKRTRSSPEHQIKRHRREDRGKSSTPERNETMRTAVGPRHYNMSHVSTAVRLRLNGDSQKDKFHRQGSIVRSRPHYENRQDTTVRSRSSQGGKDTAVRLRSREQVRDTTVRSRSITQNESTTVRSRLNKEDEVKTRDFTVTVTDAPERVARLSERSTSPRFKFTLTGKSNIVLDKKQGPWRLTPGSGWEIIKSCPYHEHCRGLTVADIARTICTGRTIQFAGNINGPVQTILQAVHVSWALRQITNQETATRALNYIQRICIEKPESSIRTHDELWNSVSNPKNMKKTKSNFAPEKLDTRDFRRIIELWSIACKTAEVSIGQDPWKSVIYGDKFEEIKDEKCRIGMSKIADQLTRLLALSRLQKHYPTKKPMYTKYIIIGDALLADAIPHLSSVYYVKAEMKETIEKIEELHFMENVKAIVICTGISVMQSYHTIETYKSILQKVDETACKQSHIRWVVVPPPGIKGRGERNGRIEKAALGPWKALEVFQFENGEMLWGRQMESQKEQPKNKDYLGVCKALCQVGIDLMPPDDSTDLDGRLQRLSDRIQGRTVISGGSVANAKRTSVKI